MEIALMIGIAGIIFSLILLKKDKEIQRLRRRLADAMERGDVYRLLLENLQKEKEEKVCDVPREPLHNEGHKAAEVFRLATGVAAKIKAERIAREKKEDNL